MRRRESAFPPEISGDPARCMSYFKALTVAHPILRRKYEELLSLILHSPGISLLFVVGPARSGKTTLKERVIKELFALLQHEMEADPGFLPVISFDAAAPDSRQFSWKDYLWGAVSAGDEPMLDLKVDFEDEREPIRARQASTVRRRTTTWDLRRSMISMFKNRHPRAVMVDEAEHLARVSGGLTIMDQMNTIKSLADETNTLHVLFGTYGLAPFRNASAQLIGRSRIVHLPRYRLGTDYPTDAEEFRTVLYTFQCHLPVQSCPSLEDRWEYMYERTVGLIGPLKKWLLDAMELMFREGEMALSWGHFERTSLRPSEIKRMLTEITWGEKRIPQEERETEEDLREIRELMGLEPGNLAPNIDQSGGGQGRRTSGGRRGLRNPTHDQVGRRPKQDEYGGT
jgi:hypothetical protein